MTWTEKGRTRKRERKTHAVLPESGASAGLVRSVTSPCTLRTWRLVILSKCSWCKLGTVWKILCQVMRWWAPSLSRIYSLRVRWLSELSHWREGCAVLSVILVEPSHWMAVDSSPDFVMGEIETIMGGSSQICTSIVWSYAVLGGTLYKILT